MSEGTRELRIVDELWQQLSAIDAARDVRLRRAARRRRMVRTFALAVLMLLLLAAVALAARTLLLGEPATRSFALDDLIAPSADANAQLLGVRVMDPDGGPPWAIRTFDAREPGYVCLQVGRVVEGQLTALGINDAFGNDGMAHPLPLESDGCVGRTAGGGALVVHTPDIHDSSAALSDPRCLDPATRAEQQRRLSVALAQVDRYQRTGPPSTLDDWRVALERARADVAAERRACDPGALRTVVTGLSGPSGGTVTLTEASGRQHVVVADARDGGAYLFVLSGQISTETLSLTVRYPDGLICDLSKRLGPGGDDILGEEGTACQQAAGIR